MNKYLINNNNKNIDFKILEFEYKKLNLGIIFRGNNYKLVILVNFDSKLFWKIVYIDGVGEYGFDKGLLIKWME